MIDHEDWGDYGPKWNTFTFKLGRYQDFDPHQGHETGRGGAKWMKTRPPQRWYFVPWRSTESIDWFQNPDSPSSLPVCCLLTFHLGLTFGLGPGLVACRPGLSTNSPAWYGGNDQIKPFLNTRTLSDSIMLGSTSVLKSEILVTQLRCEWPTINCHHNSTSGYKSQDRNSRIDTLQY